MMLGPINIKHRTESCYCTNHLNQHAADKTNAADTQEIMANDKFWYYRPVSSVCALPYWFCFKYMSSGRERISAIHLNVLGSVKSYCNTKKLHTAMTGHKMDWSLQTTGTATSPSKETEQSHKWSRNAHFFTVPKVSENFHTNPPSLRPLVAFRNVECHDRVVSAPDRYSGASWFNHLKTKQRLLYLKTQFVPHNKHFSSRL
jgi:hypothetical protein